jgi:hypothetical protein
LLCVKTGVRRFGHLQTSIQSLSLLINLVKKINTCLAAIGGGNSGLSPILLLLLLLAEAAIADVFSGKFPNCTKALLLGGPKM